MDKQIIFELPSPNLFASLSQMKTVTLHQNVKGCPLFSSNNGPDSLAGFQPPLIFAASNPFLPAIIFGLSAKPASGKNKTHYLFQVFTLFDFNESGNLASLASVYTASFSFSNPRCIHCGSPWRRIFGFPHRKHRGTPCRKYYH